MSRIAIIHGTWIPNVDDEKTWELAITPIIQTYSNSNCSRYIPEGRFSLANQSDEVLLDKALNESYKFTADVAKVSFGRHRDNITTMWASSDPEGTGLTMHNLGKANDDGIDYNVFLMIPRSLNASLRNQCFAWGGMISIKDIEIDNENDFEQHVFELIKQARFGE